MHINLRLNIIFAFFIIVSTFAYASDVTIEVDVAKKLGEVPPILKSNIWIAHPGSDDKYINQKFFQDNDPAVIHLTLHTMLPETKSFPDFKEKLRAYLTSDAASIIIDSAKKHNSIIIVGFDPAALPGWLSSRRGNTERSVKGEEWTIERSSPPKDLKLWGDVVKYTLDFFITDRGVGANHLGFYVGHEPNRDWLGSEESFFKFYEATARMTKSISRDIKVGGIGTWNIIDRKVDCDYKGYTPVVKELCRQEGGWSSSNRGPFLKNFIDYVSKNNVPLDFVNWHTFQNPPEKFEEDASRLLQWLREKKLADVKLFPSDWTYWGGAYPNDYLDTEENASYAVSALYHMWKAGIAWHGHDYDVNWRQKEKSVVKERKGAAFIGNWSIFTPDGITKPVYNAFKALSIATEKDGKDMPVLLDVSFELNDSIRGIATYKDGKTYLLLSNFVPLEDRARGILMNSAQRMLGVSDEITNIMRCSKSENAGNPKEALKACAEREKAEAGDATRRQNIDYVAGLYLCFRDKNGVAGSESCIEGLSRRFSLPETKRVNAFLLDYLKTYRNSVLRKIRFTHLPYSGKAAVTTYRIDRTHSNSCRYNKGAEPMLTDTECGIGGKIDNAVKKAKDKAKKEARTSVKQYMMDRGVSAGEIEKMNDIMEACGMKKECVTTELKKKMRGLQDKVDLKETFRMYNTSLRDRSSLYIGEINNWPEISLEGSRTISRTDLKGNSAEMDIKMEPDSITLLVIESDT